jgi:hypothetical protein
MAGRAAAAERNDWSASVSKATVISDASFSSARPPSSGLRGRIANKIWAARLLERKSGRVVSVALTNKTARTAWTVLARNQSVRGSGHVVELLLGRAC